MSTIVTIQPNDLITNSRADINTNFANLNADKIETSVIDTDTTLAANSDAKIPSQKAIKAYVDAGGNPNASETQRGIVEEATDAEVTAGTATGGSGAKLFVTPTKLSTYLGTNYAPIGAQTYGIGALSPTFAKTFYNCHLPFIIATGSVQGAATTDAGNWTRTSSSIVSILAMGVMGYMASTGTAELYIENSLLGSSGSGTPLSFNDTNVVIIDTFVKVETLTGDISWGLGTASSGVFEQTYNGTTKKIVFAVQDTGDKLYASVSNGTSNTATEITGITLTNWNNYRIVADLGADTADFYVNGVLKATVSTNFPSGSGSTWIGFGRNTNAFFTFTAPYVSIEMNP